MFKKSWLTVLASVLLMQSAQAVVDYDIFVLDGISRRQIYRIDDATGAILGSVLLPDGMTAFRLSSAGNGAVFVTSVGSNLVLKVNPLTGDVLQSFDFTSPYGVAANSQNLFVGTYNTNPKTISRLAMDGSPANVGNFPIPTTENFFPIDTEFSATGELVVSARRLRKYDPDTGAESPFRLSRLGTEPEAGFFTIHNGSFYVRSNAQIHRYDSSGVFQDVFASGLSVSPLSGTGTYGGVIQFGPNGNLFVCNWGESIIELNAVTGVPIRTIPSYAGDFAFVSIPEPSSLALLAAGALRLVSRRKRSL